jgi:hypothetical protein
MIRGERVAGSSEEAPIVVPEVPRARVVVRRRRSHRRLLSEAWSSPNSRRRTIRTVIVCASVLLLMAVGLYLSLLRHDAAPTETRLHAPVPAPRGPARGI